MLVAPADKAEAELPSPERLRRKIILKHKKLPEGADESFLVLGDMDASRWVVLPRSSVVVLRCRVVEPMSLVLKFQRRFCLKDPLKPFFYSFLKLYKVSISPKEP